MNEYYFDEHLSKEWTIFSNKVEKKKILSYLKDCKNVLDVGCGNMELADLREGIIGVDSNKYVCHKNIKAGKQCVCSTSHAMFTMGLYDAVVSFDLFEHLTTEELENTMKKIRKVLRRGGKVIFKVASYNDPELFWSDYTHVRPFTKYSLELLMKNFHFKIIDLKEFKLKGKKEGLIVYGEKK